MSKLTTRLTAMLLAGMLVIGSVPGSVLAASTDVDPGQTSEIAQDVYDEEASEAPVSDGEMAESEDTSEESASAGETAQPEEESEAPAGARKTAEESLTEDAEEAQYYTVILDANGGCFENEWDDVLGETVESTKVLNKNVPIGEAVDTFPVSDQENSVVTFLGWSLERDGEIVSQEFVPVENCILYAVWSVEKYSDANDEELESSTEDVAVEDANNQDAESPLTEDQNAEFADESADQTEESETEEALQEQFEEEYVQQEEAADEEPIQEVVTHVIENNPEEDVEKSGHSGADSNKETEPKTLSQESEQKKEAEEESVSSPSMTNAEDVTTSIIPDDAEEYNGNYYYIFDDALTWKEAKSACETRGGHLVTITNEEENDFIIDLIKGHDVQGKYHFWAGGTDEGHEGTWTWITGEQWQYTCWEPDQPNNADGNSSGGQDYLEIWHIPGYSSVLWNDEPDDGYSDHSPEAPYYLSLPYYSYICEWDSTAPKLDYLEVGFNGEVIVHWKTPEDISSISGYKVRHRIIGTTEWRTTNVSGGSSNSVTLKNLSVNDYEIGICSLSMINGNEMESVYSDPVRCPVPNIQIISPVPGTLFADSYALTLLINSSHVFRKTGNGAVHIYDSNDKEILSESLENTSENDYDSELKIICSEGFLWDNGKASNPQTLLKPNEFYHIAIDEKSIQFIEQDDEEFQVPIYLSGIKKTEDTWKFKTVSQSYPGLINPYGDKIDEQYYHLLFGNEWEKVYKNDNGSKGHCFGLAYAVGAYEYSFPCLKELTSGYSKLSDVPIDNKSNLVEYVKIAHLIQADLLYSHYDKNDKVYKLYNAVKSGRNVLVNINCGEGHTIYTLGLIDDSDPSNIKIAVYDSAYPSTTPSGVIHSFVNTITIVKGSTNNKWEFKYSNGGLIFTMTDYMEVAHEYDPMIASIATIAHNNAVSNATVTGLSTKTYTGHALEPKPTVKIGSTTLKLNTDYAVSYSNNTNVGTATVKITGKGNYTGTKTATFTINKAAQSITAKSSAASIAVGKTATVSITGNKGKKSYKSSNTAIATVTSAGKVTAKKVGTVKITATSAATANYKAASKTITMKVVPAATTSLTAANQPTGIKLTWKKVTGANGYKIYRGSTLIKTITSGSTVTFADTKANTNGTKYTYKVVAKATTGDSTLSKSRVIYRVSRPAISSVTNSASKKMTVKWGKNAKANGYQIQYSTDKAFKTGNKAVSITSASNVSRVIGSLTKGKTYYVRIRTYKTVGSTKYWSIWSPAKSVKISK